MSQRITIQYSIEMDELHDEVERLLSKSMETLIEKVHSFIRDDTQDCLTPRTLKEIDSLRQSLSSVDYSLNDVANLVNSYLTIVSPQATPASSPSDMIDSFKEKLSNLEPSSEVSN